MSFSYYVSFPKNSNLFAEVESDGNGMYGIFMVNGRNGVMGLSYGGILTLKLKD